MAFARKGYLYRQYIQNSSGGVNVPDTTWRRWLEQGRITREQLIELGITPFRRRRMQKRADGRNVPHAAASALPGIEHSPDAVMENTDMNVGSSAGGEATSSSNIVSDLEVVREANVMEIDNSGTESDFHSVQISSFSDTFTEEGSDHGDEVSSGNRMLASVLESSNIGVEKLNEPLVPPLQVTKFETLLMILHLALRHTFTDVFLEDMLAFVNELVGVADAIPRSKFLFNKLFMFAASPTTHFFCPSCNIYLGLSSAFENTVNCNQCQQSNTVSSLNNGSYFLTLSIRNQIKDVLCRPHIKLVNREQRVDQNISDIVDGVLYKSSMKVGGSFTNPNALTITFNSDGSPIFKSGNNSLWPIQFFLNEIVPEQRFEAENTLVAGLWFSNSKPSMEIFLQPFVNELKDLEKNGVVWKKPDGSPCESPVFAISCVVDSVARPQVQKIMQFNGAFGCGYCLHPNSSITVVEQLDRRSGFTLHDSDSETDDAVLQRRRKMLRFIVGEHHPLRTDRQLRQHMKDAHNTGKTTFGAKGESALCPLKYFNVVHGFPVDYMHAILLGVTRRLANLWFDSSSTGEDYYIGRMINIIDKRLTSISPPSHLRYVRPISDRVHWKANEWRGFLLFYGLPAMVNILPLPYFNHFKKLVTSVYVLSKDSMTYDDINDANQLLQNFVTEYQELYGEVNMVYNVHLCTHIAKSVSKLGPLWANSAFVFESGNGRLVKFAKGTRGVATQIARKYLMAFSVPKLISFDYKAKESVINFCSNVIGYKYLKNATTCDNVTLLGTASVQKLSPEQRGLLVTRGFLNIPNFVPVFNRAVKGGTLYCGRLTSKQIQHDDTCVRLKNAAFARIELIFKLANAGTEKVWCICREINIAIDAQTHMCPHIKQCSLDPFGQMQLLPFEEIDKKCLLISCGDKKYIAEFPNTYEKD